MLGRSRCVQIYILTITYDQLSTGMNIGNRQCLKTNLNASLSSEHPPSRGEKYPKVKVVTLAVGEKNSPWYERGSQKLVE